MNIHLVESVCKYAINKKNDVYKKNNVIFDNKVKLISKLQYALKINLT